MSKRSSWPCHAVRPYKFSHYIEIVENQLQGTHSVALPSKLGSARGALKVDGLGDLNGGLKLDEAGGSGKKKKKGGCCN